MIRPRARRLAVVAAVLVTLLSPPPADAQPVRLRFVYSGSDDAEHAHMRWAIESFNGAQDEIVVEPVSRLWRGYAIHDSLVRHLSLQDPAVDVYLLDLPWVAEFADPGWLLPLDGRLAEPADETFLPDALSGGRYRGALYALPVSLKGNMLFYREDLLGRHDLDPPRTLAELERQARLVQAADGVPVGLALHGLYTYNDFLPMLWGSGGELVSPEGAVGLRAPGARRALEALVALFEGAPPVAPERATFRGAYASSYYHPLEVFARGEAVFLIAWSPNARHLAAEGSAVRGRFGVAPIPGTEGPGPSNLGSYYVAINRGSRHPEEALRFITFMTSEEVQRRQYAELRDLPSRRELYEPGAGLRGETSFDSMHAALASARTRPRVPNERELSAPLEQALHDAIDGRVGSEEALETAARRIEDLWVTPMEPAADEPIAGEADDEPLGPEEWLGLPVLPLGVALFVPLALGTLLLLRRRYRLDVVTTLSSKMILAGIFVILELMLVAVGMVTIHSLRTQRAELAESRAFLRGQMSDHAMTIGKNLALSSSLLADLEHDREDAMVESAQTQLMMASHFSDDLLFLQLVDTEGRVVHTGLDALYGTDASERDVERRSYPPPDDLPAQVRRRSPVVREQARPAGGQYLEVLVPVFRRGVHMGGLRLGISEERLEQQQAAVEGRYRDHIRQILLVAALVTAGLLLLGTLGILVLSRRISGPVVELTDKARQIREGNLDVAITARSRDEIGTLATTMSEMVQGLRDRDFIRSTLGRYVTEEIAQRFVSDPGSLELGGHLQDVTILMSDLRGFTPMSERLEPDVLVGLLNRYLAAMTEVIDAHGGTVDEFIGDAILAVFGLLEEKPDDAVRAVTCAVAMQRALVAVNRENAELGLPELSMGIGLNSGTVIAGNIGGEKRAKYGVVGSPVNMAARVESFTVGNDVLLSETTYELVRDYVVAGEPVRVHIKGKQEPMTLYRVHGIAGRPDLVVPGAGEKRRAAVRLAAQCYLVDGKEVEPAPTPGTVVELGESSLLLEIQRDVPPHTTLKLQVELDEDRWTGDLYAKAVQTNAHPDAGYRVELALTSATPEDRAAMAKLG